MRPFIPGGSMALGSGYRIVARALSTSGLTPLVHAASRCVVKSVSIMEAQHNLAGLIREVEVGQEWIITRRRKVVAKLSPLAAESEVVFPDFEARARATWKQDWHGTSSDALLADARGDQ
jgi:antitoxin (DNA-binding transcriptional repressor) of toxin-antitoxin stability system